MTGWVQALKKDSATQWVVLKSLVADTAAKGKQIRAMQVQANKSTTNDLALIKDSAWQAKQIAELQKVNTLQGIGSVKIAKVGTSSLYQVRNDTASTYREGNLSTYRLALMEKMKVDIALIKKQIGMGGGSPASIPNTKSNDQIIIPPKSSVIIIIKE